MLTGEKENVEGATKYPRGTQSEERGTLSHLRTVTLVLSMQPFRQLAKDAATKY